MTSNSDFIAPSNLSIRQCMELLEKNMRKIVFIVDLDSEEIIGSLSDGDIRRYVLKQGSIDDNVKNAMNIGVVTLKQDQEPKLAEYLTRKPGLLVPIVDSRNRIIKIANKQSEKFYPIYSPCLEGNEIKYITQCIESNWISSKGSYVTQFEHLFEDLIGSGRYLSVANGTQALFLGLIASGVGPGDKVIVPSLTFAASVNVIIHCGAEPIFADVDMDSWCLSIESVHRLLKYSPKAVVSVDLYGNCPDNSALKKICRSNNILYIEDAAESLGTRFDDHHVGHHSDVIGFSFFGNKTITTGEGGIVGFKQSDVFERAKILRDHGMNPNRRYWHDEVGYNLRMTNLQAAIGVAQMERIDVIVEKKKTLHHWYDLELNKSFTRQKPTESCCPCWWLNSYRVEDSEKRQALISHASSHGIELRPGFIPLHYMDPYKHFKSDRLTNTEMIWNQIISLPSSPTLSQFDVEYISSVLNTFYV